MHLYLTQLFGLHSFSFSTHVWFTFILILIFLRKENFDEDFLDIDRIIDTDVLYPSNDDVILCLFSDFLCYFCLRT